MPSSKTFSRRTLLLYLGFTFLLILISSIFIPLYYGFPYVKNLGPSFDAPLDLSYQEEIMQNDPSVVILGDSTLKHSINQNELSELLGVETYRIANPGSASALWYLILKNNIATSPVKPAQLVIFSRASMLTTPEYRTTGKYEPIIASAALPEDTLVIERAYLSQMSGLEKLADQYIPLYAYRPRLREALENISKFRIPNQLLGVRLKDVERSLGDVFDEQFGARELGELSNMITQAEVYLHESERLDFDAQLPNSFLPEIVRICNENEIQLILVYTQTIYEDQSPATAKMLEDYRQALFEYAAENDIQVIDYLGDERVQPSFFDDPVHMNAEGASRFTKIFAEDFAKFLP